MDQKDTDKDDLYSALEGKLAEQVDARGLRCPMPLLKAKQALNRAPAGGLVQVLATDAGAERDFPVFTRLSGHKLVRRVKKEGGVLEFIIKKREETGL